MIRKFHRFLALLVLSTAVSCNKDACFECKKPNSTHGMCGDDARQFKRDMEKQGYTCKKAAK